MSSDWWTVLIPVKGTGAAKTRLGATAEQALAIALDTVEAAAMVAPVVVVTAGDPLPFRSVGASVIAEAPSTRGLNPALREALSRVGSVGRVACLQGDLPALDPNELDDALARASTVERAFVPDASGRGTVLLTAIEGRAHRPCFGPDSAIEHERVGYTRLEVDAAGLRHDVDRWSDLTALAMLGVPLGARTARAFARPVCDAERRRIRRCS